MRLTKMNLLWLVGYLLMVSGIVHLMIDARRNAIEVYTDEEVMADWQKFREDSQKSGPVERRMPKSDQPPALILLGETKYFTICMVASLLLSSFLFGVFMVFIRGVLGTKALVIQPPGPDD